MACLPMGTKIVFWIAESRGSMIEDTMKEAKDMIDTLVQVVPTCDEVEIISPIQVGSDGWQNELLLFVKPEAFIAKSADQVQKILALVFDKLQQFDAHVSGVAVVGGRVLDRLEIMSRHYGYINRLSQSASQMI